MKLQEKEVDAYEREYQHTVNRLIQEMPPFQEAEPFLKLVQEHFSIDVRKAAHPKVIVLGSAFPEELIHSFGITPYWVLGGSLQTGAWAGERAPRDADPVSRSMLGLLMGMDGLTQEALVLIPVVSDSTRKLAYILRRSGVNVHTIDIPPRMGGMALQNYARQLELCVDRLSAHTGRRFSLRALRRSASLVAYAHRELRRFRTLTAAQPGLFTASWRMLIGFSYYCAHDLVKWIDLLVNLNNRIENSRIYKSVQSSGSVLLMGSPVYFPNYKIPFLLQDVGLIIASQLDYSTYRTDTALRLKSTEQITLGGLARRFYRADCSASYARNDTLQSAAANLLDRQRVDGVVYCVLKGQIEYDFELERIEQLCAKRKIPVFRLETDYNQQDVEQLRIRMEAFMELLQQNRMRKEGKAV